MLARAASEFEPSDQDERRRTEESARGLSDHDDADTDPVRLDRHLIELPAGEILKIIERQANAIRILQNKVRQRAKADKSGADRPGRAESARVQSEHEYLPFGGRQAEALAPYAGMWVALESPTEVLVAADTPKEVLAWLSLHRKQARYGMFRVPSGGSDATISDAEQS